MKTIIVLVSMLMSNLVFGQIEGSRAVFVVAFDHVIKERDVLTVSGTIKTSELLSGLYFEPRNKLVLMDVPASCASLAEMAFALSLPLKLQGVVSKYKENFMTPTALAFDEKSVVRCELLRSKEK